jgi:hypothetical protein
MESVNVYRDHGTISSELITQFETSRNIRAPAAYKEIIAKHNALRPENDLFRFRNVFATTHSWPYKIIDGIDSRDISFLGFGPDIEDYMKIDWQEFDVYGHEHIIAFGMASNGDYICFDYRHDPSTDEPRVVVMFHDAYDAYDADDKMLICPVANSFGKFIDSLYKRED